MTQTPPPAPGSFSANLYSGVESVIYWLARNWLPFINVTALVYVGLPFMAPVLMKANLRGPAQVIYTIYSPLCHQFGYRTWYLFGEQVNYEAPEFALRTGIDPYSVEGRFQARAFLGNEQMGYKVGYCQRDIAIYGAIFFGGVVYAVLRRRGPVKPLHFILYLILGLGPIALDGFSQLFSQPPLSLIPFRESTPLLRVLTGAMFGLMSVWLAYPYADESFDEIKLDIEEKRAETAANDEA